MRECSVRIALTSMVNNEPLDFEHGANCCVWLGDIPQAVQDAYVFIADVESFYLQVQSMREHRPDLESVTCRLHGVSPSNRPLGARDIQIRVEDLQEQSWIEQMRQLWPFESHHAPITICAAATLDFLEFEAVDFFFAIDYGSQDGTTILVQQQIVAVNEGNNKNAAEWWAIVVPGFG
eukprot:s764_g13.t1